MWAFDVKFPQNFTGGAENGGPENAGPENAGPENAGPNVTT